MSSRIKETRVVVLADGQFPSSPQPLKILDDASLVVACDGAAVKLMQYGRNPDWVAGDLDSLSDSLRYQLENILVHDESQETNDLTKALFFCAQKGYRHVAILGATGLREDHTLGNIALLAEHAPLFDILEIWTDYGRFIVLYASGSLSSYPGQQISLFSTDPLVEIQTSGLKYPLQNRRLNSWWQGTLNEAESNSFSVSFHGGAVLVYMVY